MKVSIRLQNHGCANHPYWWIVVAPNRKNIKGRILEHVGYWAPRQGSIVQRQITLNLPRIKYWMGCGAIPTPKVQTFLNHWELMPKPFYVESTKPQKPQEQLTERDKMKAERKRKRAERLKLHYINYHQKFARYKSLQTYPFLRDKTKLKEKINAAQKENQILRELLLHNEFVKINRINELSGNAVMDDTAELLRLQQKLKQAKSELALLDKNTKGSSPLQKIQAMREINSLVDKIRAVELQGDPFRKRGDLVVQGENITKEQLDRELEYELVTKKLEKMNKELEILEKLHEAVTLEQYANHLVSKYEDMESDQALEIAETQFIQRGKLRMPPLTKFDLYYADQIRRDPDQIIEYDEEDDFFKSKAKAQAQIVPQQEVEASEEPVEEGQEGEVEAEGQENAEEAVEAEEEVAPAQKKREKHVNREELNFVQSIGEEINADLEAENEHIQRVHEKHILKFLMIRPDVIVPTNRPVHPFPDLETYIPEEYYEPIADVNLQVVHLSSLEPNDELLRYKQKRSYSSDVSSKGIRLDKNVKSPKPKNKKRAKVVQPAKTVESSKSYWSENNTKRSKMTV